MVEQTNTGHFSSKHGCQHESKNACYQITHHAFPLRITIDDGGMNDKTTFPPYSAKRNRKLKTGNDVQVCL